VGWRRRRGGAEAEEAATGKGRVGVRSIGSGSPRHTTRWGGRPTTVGARGPRARGVGGAGRRWEPAADEAGWEVGDGCEVEEQMIRWRGKGRGCRGHFTLFCILTSHEVVLSNIFSKQLLLRLHRKTAPTEPEPYKHAVSEGPTSYKLAI
jgi:hypothetical protein